MAYSDYTPPGPWHDGQTVTRNVDGVVFVYSAGANVLYLPVSGTLDMHGNRIINLQDPINPQDALTKNWFDNHVAGSNLPSSLFEARSSEDNLDALSIRSTEQ